MSRLGWLLTLTLFLPQTSSAIQLRWSDGSTDLTFSSAIRCTLIASAEPGESALPAGWRLAWVAEGCSVAPLPVGSPGQGGQPAAVCELAPPTSPADVDANQSTAYFCTGGTSPGIAQIVLDLPADSRGRLQVVALDPADPDSSRVLRSGEVRFNGGLEVPFAPLILRVKRTHASLTYAVEAVGSSLDGSSALALEALDGSWRHPLSTTLQTESKLVATAALAANVPTCLVKGHGQWGGIASAQLQADLPPSPLDPQSGCQNYFIESILEPAEIQPKDFAFVPGGWTPQGTWAFHLFYIRQNEWMRINKQAAFTTKNLGHAVSNDLDQWTVLDTAAVSVRPGMFDSQHVWAPSIVRKGITYYMLYTGVDGDDNQRIGLASSTDLVEWHQEDDPVLQVSQLGDWVDKTSTTNGRAAQLRDPFVMEDPGTPGQWLLYFVTVSALHTPGMVVGVAKSSGDFSIWTNDFPLMSTRHPFGEQRIESPHTYLRDGNWWLFYTANGDSVYGSANPYSPVRATPSDWSEARALQYLVPPSESGSYNFWHATEYLQISEVNDIRYLAAFNDAAVGISYTQMRPATSPYLFTGSCPSVADVVTADRATQSPTLSLMGSSPAHSSARLRVELPSRADVCLAIYDLQGRRVTTLLSGAQQAGKTDVVWDGSGQGLSRVGSGVYFARLTTPGLQRSLRVPLLR